jgi:hypothetical protein
MYYIHWRFFSKCLVTLILKYIFKAIAVAMIMALLLLREKKSFWLNVLNFQSANQLLSRVARFVLVHDTKTGKNVPNEHTMCQMVIKYPKCP